MCADRDRVVLSRLDKIRHMALGFTRRVPHLSADDFFQEGVLAALRGLAGWTPEGGAPQEAWVLTCAKNRMKDVYNKEVATARWLTTNASAKDWWWERWLNSPWQDEWWVDPMLREWCDTRADRRGWSWLRRVATYLKTVEDMSESEIAKAFGRQVTRQAVSQWIHPKRLVARYPPDRPPVGNRVVVSSSHPWDRLAERYPGVIDIAASVRRSELVNPYDWTYTTQARGIAAEYPNAGLYRDEATGVLWLLTFYRPGDTKVNTCYDFVPPEKRKRS